MPYPDNTTPDYKDTQAETLKEIQRILNDAKTGAAPMISGRAKALGPIREVLADAGGVALASVACSSVIFNNTSGVAVLITRGVGAIAITIPDNCGMEFDVEASANELSAESEDGDPHAVQYLCVGEAV